ncbi:MAG TPA: LysR substrate-binding domain-containing protein [Pseudomonadales bacterium]|nr:LysR substrate-binding domain-containing protein [Pseudomonadales bacterium]
MSRRLPSLNALRMFEAAARLRSFKLAAEELHVTQSAVSRQIQTLESQLGVLLFRRRNRAVEITEAGEELLPVMSRAINEIASVTERLRDSELAQASSVRLVISATPGIAELWLGRRLGRFCRAYPWIEPEILVSSDLKPLVAGHADLAIHYGAGDWPHLQHETLHATIEFPVCSPRLLRHGAPLAVAEDLRHQRLLHWQSRGWWGAWLRHFEVAGVDWNQGPLLHDYALALDMAIAGEGIALADDLLAGDHLLSGRLVKPLGAVRTPEYQQQLLLRAGTERPDAVAAFRDWIVNEVANYSELTAGLRLPEPFHAPEPPADVL